MNIPLSHVSDALKFEDPSVEQIEAVEWALNELAQLFSMARMGGWEPLGDVEAIDDFVEDQLHLSAEINAALEALEEEERR